MGLLRVEAGLLINGLGGPPVRQGAILIDGARIVEVGPASSVSRPDGARGLAFPGHAVLPGLVDCHSHLNLPGDGTTIEQVSSESDELLVLRSAENAKLALRSGVTTLRDNGAKHRTAFSVKEAIRRGIVDGPRLSVAGRPVTKTGGHCWPFGGEADGEDGVRRLVRQLIKEGADWVKVMATGGGTANTNPYRASYTPDELRGAVEEAHAADRLAAAHASCTAGIVAALDAGFDMIIHGNFHEPDGRYAFQSDIARRIADQGVWVNPTMHVGRSRVWRLERLAEQRPLTDEETRDLALQRRRYAERRDNFQGLLAAGVPLAAGSDAGWAHYRFGELVHELEAMASTGLGIAGALRAATIDSARAMGVDREVGSLEVGKLADLVVVDGDPTVDLDALTRVTAVLLGGRRVR